MDATTIFIMKKTLSRLAIAATILMLPQLALTACGKDEPDDPSKPDKPDKPENVDPDKPVNDPVGTVSLNLMLGGSDPVIFTTPTGARFSLGITNDLNFTCTGEIAGIGKVAGLGNITQIPTSGWKRNAAVTKGEGYVVKFEYYDYDSESVTQIFGRIYVSGYLESALGTIIGAQIKYQCPFLMPIKLEYKDIEFGAETGLTRSVRFLNPTIVEVGVLPEWIESVTTTNQDITFTVRPNLTAKARTTTVSLKNSESTASVTLTQKGSDKPLFAEGEGTLKSPYKVGTAQQLDNVRKAPYAVFEQTADIDLSSYIPSSGNGWEPIADFTGVYKGNLHTISGLWINRPTTSNVGLFASISSGAYSISPQLSGIILKLGEQGIKGSNYTAGICGHLAGGIDVTECSVEGNISSKGMNNYISGIANTDKYDYYNDDNNCHVSRCQFLGNISGEGTIFGIAALAAVTDCRVVGNLEGGWQILAYGEGNRNCYISGNHPRGIGSLGTSCYSSDNATDEQMRHKATYEGWDFVKVWSIVEGNYPLLRCFDGK